MQKDIVRRPHVDDAHLPNSLSPLIKQLYASRGVSSAQELELQVSNLAPVGSMKGLDTGCELLAHGITNQQKIIVIGDFDADGATSTALMMSALAMLGSTNHDFLVPNRFEYGYGLTPEIVEIAAAKGAQILVTVDNGISCHQGVNKAKELGLKVIITDHHLPGANLPQADAIINPNQLGCSFPSKSLAGVGVAFYFMLALRKYLRDAGWFSTNNVTEPNIAQLLDLVALGTVADVVSLDANNRILVEQGLKRIRAGATRPGISALIEIANRTQSQLVASDFGFALGPRINAAGRLDDMAFGINCLLAKDMGTARMMAAELDHLNKARREIEQGMQAEAEAVMKQLNFTEEALPSAISLFDDTWHQGVIGIVAGRLKEKFHRPCIVFAAVEDSDEIKGSARSIPGLHIRDVLEHIDTLYPDLIIKYGGHAMAAGLSIEKSSFEQFQSVFNEVANKFLTQDMLQGTILSDGELPNDHYTIAFTQELQAAGPWGQNFPEPVFDDVFKIVQQRIVGEKHLKLMLEKDGIQLDAIAFNIDLKRWPNFDAKQVHVAFKLDVNEFRNQQSVQLMVEHILALP